MIIPVEEALCSAGVLSHFLVSLCLSHMFISMCCLHRAKQIRNNKEARVEQLVLQFYFCGWSAQKRLRERKNNLQHDELHKQILWGLMHP